jgi:hypothetical protein
MVDSAPPSVLPSVGPGEILRFAAARKAHKVALVVGTTRLTYHDLNSFSDLVATPDCTRALATRDCVAAPAGYPDTRIRTTGAAKCTTHSRSSSNRLSYSTRPRLVADQN